MNAPHVSREIAWGSLVALGLAYEIHELRAADGVPLSKVLRRVFRTNTPVGKALFVLSVEQGSAWLIRHITEGTTTT